MQYFKIQEVNKKTSKILNECRAKFDAYSYLSDEELDKDFPIPKELTTRYFKKCVEADEENKNKSADDLEKEGVQGITLRERLVENISRLRGGKCI